MSVSRQAADRLPAGVRIRLGSGEPSSFVRVEAVVDGADLDGLVGVEILDVLSQLDGASIPEAASTAYPRWSYDSEIDALYVRVVAGRGQAQRRCTIFAGLDRGGHLFELRVPQR